MIFNPATFFGKCANAEFKTIHGGRIESIHDGLRGSWAVVHIDGDGNRVESHDLTMIDACSLMNKYGEIIIG